MFDNLNGHPAIDKWGQKKYNRPEGTVFRIESETIQRGYCETCGYDEEVMRVSARAPGKRDYELVEDMSNDLAALLREILDA